MTGKSSAAQDQRTPRAKEGNLGQKDAQQAKESQSEMARMGEMSREGEAGAAKGEKKK